MFPSSAIPTVCLVAAFAMAPVAPEASNTLFLIAGALGLLLIWPSATQHFSRPIIWMPLVGLALIALAYTLGAGLAGLVGLVYFAPLFAILPLVTLLDDTDRDSYSLLLALLAACGVCGAAIVAVVEVAETGAARAGTMVANPIHFADVALLVGFLGLIGGVSLSGWRRAAVVLVPLVATIPVVLSGTRGALVALAIMFVAAAIASAWVRLASRRLVISGLLVFAGLGAIALALGANQLSAVERLVYYATAALTPGSSLDSSTGLRLQMQLGGLKAFLESPIFGQGPFDFTAVASSLVEGTFATAPHLHGDIANMAASAGTLGLLAYGLIVVAPIAEAFRAPTGVYRAWAIVLAVTSVVGFVAMGLTNAMFGILTVTVTFAAICVVVGMLSRPGPAVATGPKSETT